MSKCLILFMTVALAGCSPAPVPPHPEPPVHTEVYQRAQVAEAQAQAERERREFWQGLAFFASAGALVLLVIGVAVGSATVRKPQGGPRE